MRRERWSGLLLTFGGIDRVAHMLGEQDGRGLVSVPSEYRLADVLRVADEQLGRILTELDAKGLAVAPGFINMLSWATTSLIADGRSQSDIRQGVTLEVFGEGWSLGPVNDAMRREQLEQQGDIKYEITWTTLAEALDTIAARGISPNIASFVGAASVRIHELAHEDRRPTRDELDRMRALVDRAMRDGALGVGSALIYAPATYANTDELVALAEVAGRHGGMYISHMRSEGNRLLEAIDDADRSAVSSAFAAVTCGHSKRAPFCARPAVGAWAGKSMRWTAWRHSPHPRGL